MNEETRAAFAAVRDHIDQIQKTNDNSQRHILRLITQNDKDIEGLRRRIQTLSQTKIVQLIDLTNHRFELIVEKTEDLERRLYLMQQELDCPERSAG